MRNEDKEIKRTLQQLYTIPDEGLFVEKTMQRLPRRRQKRAKLILGNVAIWGSVIMLAAIFYKEIFGLLESIVQNIIQCTMPGKEPIIALFICAVVIAAATAQSCELMDDYYSLPEE